MFGIAMRARERTLKVKNRSYAATSGGGVGISPAWLAGRDEAKCRYLLVPIKKWCVYRLSVLRNGSCFEKSFFLVSPLASSGACGISSFTCLPKSIAPICSIGNTCIQSANKKNIAIEYFFAIVCKTTRRMHRFFAKFKV